MSYQKSSPIYFLINCLSQESNENITYIFIMIQNINIWTLIHLKFNCIYPEFFPTVNKYNFSQIQHFLTDLKYLSSHVSHSNINMDVFLYLIQFCSLNYFWTI